MTMPMILVQTKSEVPKYGANSREAEISIAIIAMPDINATVNKIRLSAFAIK